MWDTVTGAPRGPRYALPTAGSVATIAVSADGRLLAVAQSPAIVFDASSRRARSDTVTVLRADDLQVFAESLESIPDAGTLGFGGQHLFFTPDSALLVLKGSDALTVWELEGMQRLDHPIALPAHSMALGPGAPRTLLLLSPITRALIEVDLDPRAWSAAACRVAGRALTAGEWQQYVSRTLPYRPACAPQR
jgi:hypothetical protein